MREPSEIRLGRLELEIMKVVWRKERATVADVRRALSARPPRAYTTILTMMRNLEAKGYLQHTQEDRTFVYHPALTQERVRRSALADLLERVFDGSPRLLMTGLLDSSNLSAQEAQEIRELVARRTPRKDRKQGA